MRSEKDIKDIDNIDFFIGKGIFQQIEYDRLKVIANHYGLPFNTKEDYFFALNVKVVYDGWLINLYKIDDIKNPETTAYDLTAITLNLFEKRKIINEVKENEKGEIK